jgi:hypothetical protein
VPVEVLTALRTAVRDDNRQVGLEALYAFGSVAVEPGGSRRRDMLRSAGPDLAALIGAADPALRLAAVRVIGRLFLKRPQDQPIEPDVGDAVVSALNDNDNAIKSAAMSPLGAMRYERAVQALTDMFQHYGRGDLGMSAFDALARIAHPSSAALFSAQLEGKNAALKEIAIEGLGRIGDRSKLSDVAAVQGERNDSLLLAAASRRCFSRTSVPIDSRRTLAQPRQREQARQYLVEIAAGRRTAFNRQAQDPDARLPMSPTSSAWEAMTRCCDRRAGCAGSPIRPIRRPRPSCRIPPLSLLLSRCERQAARQPLDLMTTTINAELAEGAEERRSKRSSKENDSLRPPRSPRSSSASVKLPRAFYDRPTLDVASDLLGKVLVPERRGVRTSGAIVEVEAYIGESDPVCTRHPARRAATSLFTVPRGTRTCISTTAFTTW